MEQIKKLLTDEQIKTLFFKELGCDGGWALYEITPGNTIQFARAIERAVLEAAPASSAMAQAVDAAYERAATVIELYDDATMQDDYTLSADECAGIIRALQSQQSPVQASDAGRQG